MNVSGILPQTLLDAAEAIGLASAGGEVNKDWFGNPLQSIESILTNASQRTALFDLLDQLLPATPIAGVTPGAKWHPLLGTQADGNLYLTVDDTGTPTVIGLGGRYSGAQAALLAEIPLVALNGSSVSAIAGTAGGPLRLSLEATLDWTTATHPIALASVSLALVFAPTAAPPVANIVITLQGLDLDGTGAKDVTVDSAALGSEAAALLLGLVREKLDEIAAGAPGDAKALAANLIPLLGLDGSFPAFPFATLASGPQALTGWLRALATGEPPPFTKWLSSLAGLLGIAAPKVNTSVIGKETISTFPILAPNGSSAVTVGLIQGFAPDGITPTLGAQIGATLAPSTAGPAAISASVTLFSAPTSGPASATALPAASFVVQAPAGQAPLIAAAAGEFSIDSIRAGIAWDGTQIAPLIELDNVVIPGAGSYPKIDLTNANTVIAAAASGLVATITNGLGATGAGAHIAALAGLVAPSADAAAPLVDIVQLVAHPTAAIAALHRNALLSAAHPWSIYLTELGGLLLLPGEVSGSGKPADPWSLPISTGGPLGLALVAWNAQLSGSAADPQQLRIGLRLQGGSGGAVSASWTSVLLAADMPASGANRITLCAEHDASVAITPTATSYGSTSLSATGITAAFSLTAASGATVQAAINGLAVTTPTGTINVPTLPFPFPAGFDPQAPTAALGITAAQLESLVAGLLSAAFTSALGGAGTALAILAGCGAGVSGLPLDLPGIADAAAGKLFTDPAGAVRAWVADIAANVSASGGDFASPVVAWLAALLSDALPEDGISPPPALAGTGTYDDPWILPVGGAASGAQGVLWIEPDGPASAAAELATAFGEVQDFSSLAAAIAFASRYLGGWPAGLDAGSLATGLQSLDTHLSSSDGVVPVTSELPSGGSWGNGNAIGSAHSSQPFDPAAISQITAQADAWAAPGGPRAILLLGPAFSDHSIWNQLLTQAEAAHAGSTSALAKFNLRVPGVAPASIDLRPVTTIADYYTADLQDDGTGDVAGLTDQVGLIVARLNALLPGAPVILVAHSTAGLAARAYTAANATAVKGLITLGTPYYGTPLTPLIDEPTADALRAIADWLPGGFPAGPLQDAFQHLLQALDGYLPPGSPGALPVAWPYPIADFDGTGDIDTGGVPALALGGQIGGATGVNLLESLMAALAARIAAYTAGAPTHLGFGVQVQIPLVTVQNTAASSTSAVAAEAALRVDAGLLALQTGAVAPARPVPALTTSVSLWRNGGWLAGDARSYTGTAAASDIRVRGARLGVVTSLYAGSLKATPFGSLEDAAFHGVTVPSVAWGDPTFASALGSIFASIGAGTGAAPGTALGNLLALLQALGIATVPAASGDAIGIAADAVNALAVDPLSFLTPRIAAAFAGKSVPGFSASPEGGYACAMGSLPLETFVTITPPAVGLRTVAGSIGLTLGTVATLTGSVTLPLATMTPAIAATLNAGPGSIVYSNGLLSLQVPVANTTLSLVPAPTAAAAKAAFVAILPPLLASAAASALIDALLPAGSTVKGLISFLQSPWNWLVQSTALGNGTALDPAKLTSLFGSLGALPGGLTVNASGTDPTTITLATGAPIGGVVSISAGMAIDGTGHEIVVANIGINTPTTAGSAWPSVGVAFGVTDSGLSLSVTPGGMAAIQLLPTFDGAAALAGAAKKLLPDALDGMLNAIAPGPKPPLVTLALQAATALDLYDSVGGFEAHADQLAAMTGSGWFGSLSSGVRSAFVTAAAAYFNDPTSPLHGALPGAITASGTALTWSYTVPAAAGSGAVSLTAGWDGGGPTLAVGATGPGFGAGSSGVLLANGPVAVTLSAGVANGAIRISGNADVTVESSLGLSVAPAIAFSLGAGGPSFTLMPLGSGAASTMSLQLAPQVKLTSASDGPAKLIEDWVVPLVADLLISAMGASFTTPIYGVGPNTETLLKNAGIITVGAGPQPYALKTPLPAVGTILSSLLQSLPVIPVNLSADPPLTLLLGSYNNLLGIGLQGSIPIASGSPSVSILFGQPGDAANIPGIQLGLFATGATPTFAPTLAVRGIGAEFAGQDGAPLINESGCRIGDIEAFVAFQFDLAQAHLSSGLGGGVSIGQLGLPLGLLDSTSSSNPVAASLLGSDSGSGGGDSSAVNPAVDVEVTYLNSQVSLRLAGSEGPVVIPIHANFGPLFISQIDLSANGTESVSLGIDANLSISGLDVGLDDLALLIPIASVLKAEDWTLDLQGLAVSFESGPVEITGGLRKSPGNTVEYDGMLSASIADLGLTVVGSYARPSDAQGGYTSVFMFAALLDPLGGPPMAFVTGLGGGFGYNRELIVPDDPNELDSFILVAAMDDDSLANDPLGALMQMSQSIPPRRGAFWLAAGVRLTSFALINSTIIVTIAVDRGLDIEILGISRMALPTESTAIISVELAVRARFNSSEQILSVQAQLTDNSYLFSRDCQLTGGFALMIWYGQGQFVLTLGGYNPIFTKPAEFPDVPRLGFNWDVSGIVVIKGGSYFALTNSCVMAGGSLSATATIGPVSAWFDAYMDFLISWDPFYYSFDIGIEIGMSVNIEVCFFGCVTIGITISKGASLTIAGPPFHGTVSVDAYVTTITVSFGDPPQPPPYITNWGDFASQYLTAGDPNGSAVSVQITRGLMPTDPPGAQPQPGTESQPWQLGAEFSLASTTRMPASSAPPDFYGAPISLPGPLNTLDLAAMDRLTITSTHSITLQQWIAGNWQPANIKNGKDHFTVTATQGFFPEASWHWVDPEHLPAAARTITALSGFTIDAHVVLNNESDVIAISTLVTDKMANALPLPFATTAAIVPVFKAYGVDAAALAAEVANATSQKTLAASVAVLAGANAFAAGRTALNLPAQGLAPLAKQALLEGRAAPPLLTPLTTGLTMEPVGLPAPTLPATIAPPAPILLAAPRVRAVLQTLAVPVTDAPPAQHTSVAGLLPALLQASPRTAPPGSLARTAVPGARLIVIPAAAAPRPTRAALATRALRHADLGAAIGPAHQGVLDQAATDILAGGVQVGAGATHLWDVPDDQGTFNIAGDGAVRMVCMDRGGSPLLDLEFNAASSAAQSVPAGTAMVAIQCLGALPEGAVAPAPGFGAITGGFAPCGEAAVVGWQSAGTLLQIGPTRFMARGATVRLPQAHATARNGQRASYGTPRAAEVVGGQAGIETRLPAGIGVVMIALDIADATSVQTGDLTVACSGGTLSTSPQRVTTGGRRLLLYDVTERDAGASALIVSVASATGYRLGGVIGLHGIAAEWANLLSYGIPDHFVPDGALFPGGSLTVTYTGETA